MALVMRLLAEGTPFDGQYLVSYDPEQDGVDSNGDEMVCRLETTTDLAQAKRYADLMELSSEWKRPSKREPLRPDGRPNRPLAAFGFEAVPV